MIQPNIFQIYFLLTMECNLKCKHCIRNYADNNPNSSVSINRIQDIFYQIKNSNINPFIILTGGEPTVHKNFFDILNLASNIFKYICVDTNGVLSPETLAKFTDYRNLIVQISVDGDEIAHDKIRGAGMFKKSMESIIFLTSHGTKVIVSTVVNKNNVTSISQIANILSSLKIYRWQIEMEQSFSDDTYSNHLEIDDWNNFVEHIITIARNPLTIRKLYDFLLFEKAENKYGVDHIKNNVISNCGFCKNKIYIYPDFSVRACTCIPNIHLGNMNQNSFNEIIQNMKKHKELLTLKDNSPCVKCHWRYLCNGGCLGYSYHFKGDIGFGDIRCPIVKETYGI